MSSLSALDLSSRVTKNPAFENFSYFKKKTQNKSQVLFRTFCLAIQRTGNTEIPQADLWKTSHYPEQVQESYHSIKTAGCEPFSQCIWAALFHIKARFWFYFYKALQLPWLSHIPLSISAQPASPDLPPSPFRDLWTVRNRCSQSILLVLEPKKD